EGQVHAGKGRAHEGTARRVHPQDGRDVLGGRREGRAVGEEITTRDWRCGRFWSVWRGNPHGLARFAMKHASFAPFCASFRGSLTTENRVFPEKIAILEQTPHPPF